MGSRFTWVTAAFVFFSIFQADAGMIPLPASVVTSAKGFTKFVYSFPIPVQDVAFSGLSGQVSIDSKGDGPSEALFSVGYVANGKCLSSGISFKDYESLFKAMPGAVGLAAFIVKNYGAGHQQIETNFQFPVSTAIAGCVYVILDGGGSLGLPMTLTMTSAMSVSYESTLAAAPTVRIGSGDEFCFGWPGGCRLSTTGQGKSFEAVSPISHSGTLVALYGDVSEGALSKPSGSWSARHGFYLSPGCVGVSPGNSGPADFFTSLPSGAVTLLEFGLEGEEVVLQRPVDQPLALPVQAGDCLVHIVQVDGTGGVDAEGQVRALLVPTSAR